MIHNSKIVQYIQKLFYEGSKPKNKFVLIEFDCQLPPTEHRFFHKNELIQVEIHIVFQF